MCRRTACPGADPGQAPARRAVTAMILGRMRALVGWLAGGTIRTKLNAIFGGLLVVMIAIASVTFDRLFVIRHEAQNIRGNVLPATQLFGKLASLTERYRLLEAEHVFVVAPAEMTRIEKEMEAVDAAFGDTAGRLAAFLPKESQAALAALRDIWRDFAATGQKIAKQSRDNDDVLVNATYKKEAAPLFAKLQAEMKRLLDANVSDGNRAAETSAMATENTGQVLGGAIALGVLVCLAAMWFVRRAIIRPILAIVAVMERLAGRDLSVEIDETRQGDEIGAMQRAIIVFKDSMLQSDRLEAVRREGELAKEQRAQRLAELNREFDAAIQDELHELNGAASTLRTTAESMSGNAGLGVTQTGAVVSAAEQASTNVQTIAAATEQLSASVQGISHHVAQSSEIAAAAVTEAEQSLAMVQSLSEAAQRIGSVVGLINQIASQTNLLALNATIEAARAGEAGRGFAVVASEVKSLATQTEKATGDIVSQITAMQGATEQAVDAIARIDETIGRISEISRSIASAIDQQGAATQEIARNIQETAKGTSEVTSNMAGLNAIVGETGRGADGVLSAAQVLGAQADRLRRRVDAYLDSIKAA